MSNFLIYKKIYHNNLELKEIYTMCSKQVHNVYRFMYHYICKLRINLISQYFPVNTGISCRPGKYEYFPLFCQPCHGVSYIDIVFSYKPKPYDLNNESIYQLSINVLRSHLLL